MSVVVLAVPGEDQGGPRVGGVCALWELGGVCARLANRIGGASVPARYNTCMDQAGALNMAWSDVGGFCNSGRFML